MANLYVVSSLWQQFKAIADTCNISTFPVPCGNTNTADPPVDANVVQRQLLSSRCIYNGNFIFTVADWTAMPETVSYGTGSAEVTVSVSREDRQSLASINLGEIETAAAMYREPFKTYELQVKSLDSAIERLRRYIEQV